MPKDTALIAQNSRSAVSLSATFAVLCFGFGVHLPYFPLWLADRGLSAAEVGVLMAAPLIARVATLPLTTHGADRFGDLRIAIAVFALVSMILVAAFDLVRGFWALLGLTLAIGAFWGAIMPILDGLTISMAQRNGLDYGRVRLWGSLSFIAASISIGALVDWTSIHVIIPTIAVSLVLLAGVAMLIPKAEQPAHAAPPRLVEGVRQLVRVPGLPLLLVGAALVQSSHALLYVFGSIHWKALGYSETLIGVLWAIGVIAEIMFFAVSGGLLARFGIQALLVIGAVTAVLRWTVMAFDPPLLWLFALQVLHAGTFAAIHLAMVNALGRAMDQRYAAMAQGVYFAALGLFNGVAFLATGPVYDSFAGGGHLVMAATALVGLVLIVLGAGVARNQPQSARDGG
jgi:PPP family 3-phenylpropionic acid transporter